MIVRPRVKFCGMTRVEDAVAAADLGVDAVGFVFWERSPRCVSREDARAMSRALPPWIWRVGVFVNASIDEMRTTVETAGLDVVQLHGDEPPEVAAALGGRVIKAVAAGGGDMAAASRSFPSEVLVLVDAADAARRGGTGALADWSAAAALAAGRRMVLAGGLTADNVGAAVRMVRPYAVDVASGVEQRPGIKDRRRMEAFMRAVASVVD